MPPCRSNVRPMKVQQSRDGPGTDPTVGFDVREFYTLWLVAVLLYGAGDTITSIAILGLGPGLVEANPLIRTLVQAAGVPGLVAVKLIALIACLFVSLSARRLGGDPLVYYGPPAMLAIVGAFTTAFNARLLGW